MIPVELIDPRYYHLDTCFCPLAPGEAIWYPPAFDDYGQLAIRTHVPNLIEAERVCTSFDMAGASLTLFWLDDELERFWARPADTPAYRKGSVAAAEQLDPSEIEAAPRPSP